MYIVIQEFERAAMALAVVLGTSAILKFTWYDHLGRREAEIAADEARVEAATDHAAAPVH